MGLRDAWVVRRAFNSFSLDLEPDPIAAKQVFVDKLIIERNNDAKVARNLSKTTEIFEFPKQEMFIFAKNQIYKPKGSEEFKGTEIV